MSFKSLLLLTFFFLFPLGQLQRVEVGPGWAIYIHDLLILTWVLWWGINLVRSKRKGLVKSVKLLPNFLHRDSLVLELGFITWATLGLLSAAINKADITTSILFITRLSFYCLFAFTAWLFIKSKKSVISSKFKYLKWSPSLLRELLVFSGFMFLLFGFVQYIFIPDTRFLFLFGWDNHYFRLISTLFDPAFTGILFTLVFILFEKHKTKRHILKNLGLLSLTTGIALTFSRASYLAWFVTTAALSALNKNTNKKPPTWFYLLFFLILLPILPKPGGEGVNLARTSTITARTSNDTGFFDQFESKDWLLGKGLFVPHDNYRLGNHARVPNNIFVLLLSGTGGVGLLLSTLIGLKWGVRLWQKDKHLFLSFLAIIIHSQFNNTFFQPFVFLFFLLAVVSRSET